uniref:Uncharacterized protein n=1 Tax=Rangifer tarandus platyrhynchus TaxID=3082113 RepID=A0ACB0EWE6_RANTA|nr:unnamed protein product [Rangifer tarandus platyrhynchus]
MELQRGAPEGRGMELQWGAPEGRASLLPYGGSPRDVPWGPETSVSAETGLRSGVTTTPVTHSPANLITGTSRDRPARAWTSGRLSGDRGFPATGYRLSRKELGGHRASSGSRGPEDPDKAAEPLGMGERNGLLRVCLTRGHGEAKTGQEGKGAAGTHARGWGLAAARPPSHRSRLHVIKAGHKRKRGLPRATLVPPHQIPWKKEQIH